MASDSPYAEEFWRDADNANTVPEMGEYRSNKGERMVVDHERQDSLWSVCYWGADGTYNGAEHFELYSSLKSYVLDRVTMDGYRKV